MLLGRKKRENLSVEQCVPSSPLLCGLSAGRGGEVEEWVLLEGDGDVLMSGCRSIHYLRGDALLSERME